MSDAYKKSRAGLRDGDECQRGGVEPSLDKVTKGSLSGKKCHFCRNMNSGRLYVV